MGGAIPFKTPPKGSTPIYNKPPGGRGQRVVIGYSVSSDFGTANYDRYGKPTNRAADNLIRSWK